MIYLGCKRPSKRELKKRLKLLRLRRRRDWRRKDWNKFVVTTTPRLIKGGLQ